MFYSGKPEIEILIADGITLVAGMILGATHCVAWSFHFPSHTESLLWRFSSAAITAVPLLVFVATVTTFSLNIEDLVQYPFIILLVLSGLLYIATRVITVVLAFMTLASLPLGAFQTIHWTTLIPHV
jgi:EamA domain-containing membrane protein RarD